MIVDPDEGRRVGKSLTTGSYSFKFCSSPLEGSFEEIAVLVDRRVGTLGEVDTLLLAFLFTPAVCLPASSALPSAKRAGSIGMEVGGISLLLILTVVDAGVEVNRWWGPVDDEQASR